MEKLFCTEKQYETRQQLDNIGTIFGPTSILLLSFYSKIGFMRFHSSGFYFDIR